MATAEELKDLGNKAFATGKFQEAIEHFTEAISLDSKNHVLFSNRSAAYASLGKYHEARTDAEKTVSLKGDWAKGFCRLGAALHGLKRYNEASKAYNQGLALEPENKGCKDGLASVNGDTEKEEDKGMSSIASAFCAPDALAKLTTNPATANFMKDPKFVETIKAIQANPSLVQLYMKDQRVLQSLLALMGISGNVMTPDRMASEMKVDDDSDDEVVDMDTASTAPQPSGAPKAAAPSAATSSSSAHATQPATEAASAAKEDLPADQDLDSEAAPKKISAAAKAKAAAEKELGTAAYKQRDFETAHKHYGTAASLNPLDPIYLLNISAVYFEQKENDKCIEVALKAVEVAQENKASFETIAKAFARASRAAAAKDDLEAALKFIGKALTNQRLPEYVSTQKKLEAEIAERKRQAFLDPVKAIEHKNKGNDLFKAGDFPGAQAEYTESIRRNPDDSKVFGNRAACYIKLAAFPLAIQDCEAALKLEPGFVKAFIRKGNALTGMKKHSEALSAFNKALEFDSNNSEALEGASKCRQFLSANTSQKERAEAAMQDPEVRQIMSDPVMQQILQQMTQDPKAAREHFNNPEIAAKLQKLMDSGLISVG